MATLASQGATVKVDECFGQRAQCTAAQPEHKAGAVTESGVPRCWGFQLVSIRSSRPSPLLLSRGQPVANTVTVSRAATVSNLGAEQVPDHHSSPSSQ